MRALLIDPTEKSFTEVEYNGDWKTIAPLLGCELFTVVYTDVGDVFVDDEGLYNTENDFFVLDGVDQPLCGRGLIFGPADDEGNTTPATISIGDIEEKVFFMSRSKVYKMFA